MATTSEWLSASRAYSPHRADGHWWDRGEESAGGGADGGRPVTGVGSRDHWSLAGWTVNPNVFLVLGEGHQVGWVERALPGLGLIRFDGHP
ncbi:hypothetical protein [Kitasatospora sp. NPDC001175]|uniref:hypothetical protein n=1 Tax=Kitasatospora sp. NPDC001175 TaxID=3157103 RepID=UPI003CFF5DC2